jgi:sec-independent protein translocase protein TatA
MLSPGPWQILMVLMIGLLLFGKKLPEIARSLGKGLVEFKKGIKGIEDEVDRTHYDIEEAASSSSASRPAPRDEADELTAPKFQPPKAASTEPVKAATETAAAANPAADKPTTDA